MFRLCGEWHSRELYLVMSFLFLLHRRLQPFTHIINLPKPRAHNKRPFGHQAGQGGGGPQKTVSQKNLDWRQLIGHKIHTKHEYPMDTIHMSTLLCFHLWVHWLTWRLNWYCRQQTYFGKSRQKVVSKLGQKVCTSWRERERGGEK